MTKGKPSVAEIGDWDYREVAEMKVMNQITGSSRA